MLLYVCSAAKLSVYTCAVAPRVSSDHRTGFMLIINAENAGSKRIRQPLRPAEQIYADVEIADTFNSGMSL
uniref:Uncharacterized protein n=1 Tax=viral metagenome TaxID=1070528 RepID=A0A6C0C0L0_9ZZZZ